MLNFEVHNPTLIDFLLLLVLLFCCYTDLRTQKIYNYVLLPAVLAAMLINFTTGGLSLLGNSLVGLLAGMALLTLPFAAGGIGAGDVKLMGAVGAFKGPEFALIAFLAAAIAGGVFSVYLLIRQKKMMLTLNKIYYFCFSKLFHIPVTVNFGQLDTAARQDSFPYALAISAGAILAYFLG
ncbi:MAG: hypothetical protein JL56_12260 [Desulfotomaculum sp. BICA1-6]|nr:MAG: hypothetical protein VR67_17105 [Peptococcaceae bacterium BRH_c8a]KJS72797.1 MAG: hypothetical protein JL56_12260 [Desulfotomaculum sp. BICA1-6]